MQAIHRLRFTDAGDNEIICSVTCIVSKDASTNFRFLMPDLLRLSAPVRPRLSGKSWAREGIALGIRK
jgi:hypothetical protein